MKAEYQKGCPQRDSVEREEYVGAQSIDAQEGNERDGTEELLEKVLRRKNLNNAYERVKKNKGAPGIDGMTVTEALPWLKENKEELLQSIRDEKCKPSSVRRKAIPNPDGNGERLLGIPTVIDRVIQQAISQCLQPIYEPLFSDSSYSYRPGRSGQMAIKKVKGYVEEGYTHVVEIDLSKYFDTINHEMLMNIIRRNVKDKKVVNLIKKYLKSGVMENGVVVRTEEGSPQGGPISPLLANIYLNEFDQEMERRGVRMIRYADDIVVFAKSKRATERLMETTKKFLEGKLKLIVNEQKTREISIFSNKFKFLGFRIAKNENGVLITAHKSSLAKAKKKIKLLTKRNQGRDLKYVLEQLKVFIQGWLGYFSVASMKSTLGGWNMWLRRRIRMYIWKQWKLPKTRVANLMKLGISKGKAYQWGNSRLGYWRVAGSPIMEISIQNKRLEAFGLINILKAYEHLNKRY